VAVPPKGSYTPQPKYPDSAEKKGLAGAVNLRVLVSEKGAVAKHEVRGQEGGNEDQLFVNAVLEALPLWKFLPALDEEGKPIEAWKEYRLVFKMQGSR
jgi:TonB family protein